MTRTAEFAAKPTFGGLLCRSELKRAMNDQESQQPEAERIDRDAS